MFFWPDSNSSRIIFARHSSFLLFINYTLPFRLLLMYCQHQLPPSMRLRWGDVQIHSLCCCIRPKCFAYPLRKLAQAFDFGQRWMSKWPTEPKPTTTQHFVTFWMRVESQLVHRINWHSKKNYNFFGFIPFYASSPFENQIIWCSQCAVTKTENSIRCAKSNWKSKIASKNYTQVIRAALWKWKCSTVRNARERNFKWLTL